MSTYPQMTLSGIAQTMQINLMREVPQTMMILGQSGVGKTQWFRFELPKLVAKAKGVAIDKVAVILTQPSSRDATEFAGVGIPSKNDEGQLVTRFSLPNLIEQIEFEKASGAEYVIVVLDELSGAADDVMKAVAPILDVKQKQLGEFPLPDKTLVVATGNRSKDKAGSRRLLAHLPTRMKTVELMFGRLIGSNGPETIRSTSLSLEPLRQTRISLLMVHRLRTAHTPRPEGLSRPLRI